MVVPEETIKAHHVSQACQWMVLQFEEVQMGLIGRHHLVLGAGMVLKSLELVPPTQDMEEEGFQITMFDERDQIIVMRMTSGIGESLIGLCPLTGTIETEEGTLFSKKDVEDSM